MSIRINLRSLSSCPRATPLSHCLLLPPSPSSAHYLPTLTHQAGPPRSPNSWGNLLAGTHLSPMPEVNKRPQATGYKLTPAPLGTGRQRFRGRARPWFIHSPQNMQCKLYENRDCVLSTSVLPAIINALQEEGGRSLSLVILPLAS